MEKSERINVIRNTLISMGKPVSEKELSEKTNISIIQLKGDISFLRKNLEVKTDMTTFEHYYVGDSKKVTSDNVDIKEPVVAKKTITQEPLHPEKPIVEKEVATKKPSSITKDEDVYFFVVKELSKLKNGATLSKIVDSDSLSSMSDSDEVLSILNELDENDLISSHSVDGFDDSIYIPTQSTFDLYDSLLKSRANNTSSLRLSLDEGSLPDKRDSSTLSLDSKGEDSSLKVSKSSSKNIVKASVKPTVNKTKNHSSKSKTKEKGVSLESLDTELNFKVSIIKDLGDMISKIEKMEDDSNTSELDDNIFDAAMKKAKRMEDENKIFREMTIGIAKKIKDGLMSV